MKVVAYNGSPRLKGNTHAMIEILFEELNKEGIETVEINVALTGRGHCRGNYPIGVVKKGTSYIAQINYMGSKKHLGSFTTVEEAFNAYKKAKEKCLKEYADKFKDVITDKVYNALYSYSIEIED